MPGIDVAASPDLATVLREVVAGRLRQDRGWGEQDHPPMRWLAILTEEVGEVARAALAFDDPGYRAELAQAAAVCIAAIESLDRAARRRAPVAAEEEDGHVALMSARAPTAS